jgi:hypothetical protein
MFFLISSGPYRDLARLVLGIVLLVVGILIKATNPHWILIAAGALLILIGATGGIRRHGHPDAHGDARRP